MKKHIRPVFCGYGFEVYELDNAGALERYYGYQLFKGSYNVESTGCYKSVELATRAALARIETRNFDLSRFVFEKSL